MAATETPTETDTSRECEHGELWLALDGQWYCAICNPPVFETEVLDRREMHEVMRLFDDDRVA